MDKKSRELVMAKLYFKNKDYKMAEKCFNEYLEMNPTDASATKLLAQVYEQNKRFDKAFEMYERCYLADPDRTGVLLDICRILLMNEIWLEHVDYRKWLNLAIKAFPSNPIVVNLKACLTTLPPGDQKAVSKEEDPLERIFEKLCSMESRLEKIEEKLKNSASEFEEKLKNSASALEEKLKSSPVAIEVKSKNSTPVPEEKLKSSPATIEDKSKSPTPKAGEKLNNTPSFTDPKSSPFAYAAQPSLFGGPANFNFSSSGNLFQQSLQKFNLSTDGGWASNSSSNFSFSKPKEEEKSNFSFSKPKEEEKTNFSFSKTVADEKTSGFSFSKAAENEKSNFSYSKPLETNFSFSKPLETNLGFSKPLETNLSFSKPIEDEKTNEEGEENELAPNEELAIENTCDMEPIEIKTGEENEDLVFEHRCKLFRFRDKEYKERGLGSIKVLKHKTTGKGRLIMRREAIGLVCLNCWDCNKIERVRETQVRWIGLDASDGDPEPTVFLVKFKTQELTDTFMSHLTALFPEDGTTNTSVSSPQVNKPSTTNSGSDKPDVELVDPKLNPYLVDKARQLQLPDLFYHKLKNQEPCTGCDGCDE